MDEKMKRFLSGEELYGNNFSIEDIEIWYNSEKEAYAELLNKDKSKYFYGYHALNRMHGFSKFELPLEASVLGIGAAYGEELLPIAGKTKSITILDPSDAFVIEDSPLKAAVWKKPSLRGEMDFEEGSFDLVTGLGVLHHIPNVEFVLNEIHRVLKKGGVLMLREPIVSMGDWTRPRQGLTKNERGIPEGILMRMCEDAGFSVVSKRLCGVSAFAKMVKKIGYYGPIYNNGILTRIDFLISKALSFNSKIYHRTSLLEKLSPSSVFLVLRK